MGFSGGPDRTRICDLYRVKVRKSISCRPRCCVFRNLQKSDLDSNWTPRRLSILVWTPLGLQRMVQDAIVTVPCFFSSMTFLPVRRLLALASLS